MSVHREHRGTRPSRLEHAILQHDDEPTFHTELLDQPIGETTPKQMIDARITIAENVAPEEIREFIDMLGLPHERPLEEDE